MPENFIQSSFQRSEIEKEDVTYEVPLRPQALGDFVGQDQIRERLEVIIGAAKQRSETLGHCLFSGPPGLGKTTLASIIAKAMGSSLTVTSGPVLEKAGDLAGILTGLKKGDILFIDEIHRLNRTVEEYLYPAMEDFSLDIVIDSGPNARSLQMKLEPFTLVAATTRTGLLTAPLRTRFGFSARLDYYSPEVLVKIVLRTGRILNVSLGHEGAMEIARRSRGTPRIANNLLRWVRDYSQIRCGNRIDLEVVRQALGLLAIDELGLDEMDIKILRVMIELYQGGPVGLSTIAVAVGEEPSTIEEVYEPFLIMQGLLKRTPRGREVTLRGEEHIKTRNFTI
jgi:Holliday junction DNA helicase RuvB